MKLRKIVVENFRQLFGINEIQFALPGERNTTVILGENGAGKTTLLNAFIWCLYGKVELENPNEVLSHRAAKLATPGSPVAVEVRLLFDADNTAYTVIRRKEFRKNDTGAISEISNGADLTIYEIPPDGNQREARDPIQTIGQLLPPDLSKFFFFRGEDMENLALQTGAAKLRDGVETFLELKLIDNAVNHLGQVARDFEDTLGSIAVGDIKQLQNEIDAAEADLLDAQRQLENANNDQSSVEQNREATRKELSDMDATRPLLEQQRELERRRNELEDKLKVASKQVAETVSKDGYLLIRADILQPVLRLRDQAKQTGELPAKIKPQFVDDLLGVGKCICGRPIDDDSRNRLLTWKGERGLAELEESIFNAGSAATYLGTRAEDAKRDLDRRRASLADIRDEMSTVVGEHSRIDSELKGKNFGLDYIGGLQQRLRDLDDQLVEAKVKVARAQAVINEKEQRLGELREQRKEKSKHRDKESLIERQIEASQAAASALNEMKAQWTVAVQEYLDAQLKASWRDIAQLDRLVEFPPDFHLTMKERGHQGWIMSAPSSANLRGLALCFVSSLIKLAREIGSDRAQDSIRLFRGGDFPLVMDAPFAHMDEHFKRVVPLGLRKSIPQIVLMSNFDQWQGHVENALRDGVNNAYVLELHTPTVDETRGVKVLGSEVDYVVREVDEDMDWSVIKEVAP